MNPGMVILGYILIGAAILPYIAVPILIWTTQRFSSAFYLRHVQESFLPKEVREEFQTFRASVSVDDFEHCFDVFTNDEFLGLRFYHRVLMSRVLKSWAICTAICDEEGTLHKKYVELKTQYVGGTTFSTHNSDLIGAPLNSSLRKAVSLPTNTQTRVILDVHLLHLKKAGNEQNILVPMSESAVDTFRQFLSQDHDDQVDLGALYYDDQEKMYRPTWAGAFLLGWYSMWPSTLLRRVYTALKMRVLMREIASPNP